MGMSAERELNFEVDAGRLFQAFTTAVPASGMSVSTADVRTGLIQASSSVGLASWGENIQVVVTAVAPGRSRATLTSSLKFGLVDWGKNRKNLDTLETAVRTALTGPAAIINTAGIAAIPRPPVVQPAGWYPDPAGPNSLRWWDGARWTKNTAQAGSGQQPAG